MRYNADASATYKMLDDGTWGVWLSDTEGRVGKTISVTTSRGKVKAEKLAEKLWQSTDGKLSLWRIEEHDDYEVDVYSGFYSGANNED